MLNSEYERYALMESSPATTVTTSIRRLSDHLSNGQDARGAF
jgi:hypothetical protein